MTEIFCPKKRQRERTGGRETDTDRAMRFVHEMSLCFGGKYAMEMIDARGRRQPAECCRWILREINVVFEAAGLATHEQEDR